MIMKDYKELLKDGRWQIRKTEIMRRDNFTCQKCGARAIDGAFLNVHHVKYRKSAKPWEYEDNELVTLCEDCHKAIHDKKDHYIKTTVYKDTGLKIGDLVTYEHGDCDNYGFVYGHGTVYICGHIIETAKAVFVDCWCSPNAMWFCDIISGRKYALEANGYEVLKVEDVRENEYCYENLYKFVKHLVETGNCVGFDLYSLRINEFTPIEEDVELLRYNATMSFLLYDALADK